ncbi:MAG: glycosyltransferase family 2 protein [Chitinophagaceae bacterium]|nr:MAG: glycosyltransferase family 2 protein [Chitinophagaceae bacterium]
MEKNLPLVAVVILSWKGQHFLKRFLPPLLKTTYPNAEYWVIDNASNDGTEDFLKSNFPEVKSIILEENLGFAGGYNEGLKKIKADYYVLLNQDVEVEPDWIEPVIAGMEKDKNISAAQPLILDEKNRDYFEYAGAAGGFIDKLGYPFCRGRIFDSLEKNENQYDESIEIFWATGACMFVRADDFHEAGGLDKDFFAHMEEIDLCWRLKNKGKRIICITESKVYHVGGGSLPQGNPRKTFLNFRNSLRMLIKNLPDQKFKRTIFLRLILDGIAALKSLSEGKFSDIGAILKAHISVYKEWNYWLKKRKLLKKHNDFNNNGLYDKSIIYSYFIKKYKTFKSLNIKTKKID